MKHSGMLYQLDISKFYFYRLWLFQKFFPWKFIKTLAFLCLVSLLKSIAMQITIFYKYICFKYDTVWNHFHRFFMNPLSPQLVIFLSLFFHFVVLTLKGNSNSQGILNWIIQILHYYYSKQHKNIKNSQTIEQNLVIFSLPFSWFTATCASFAV